MVSNNSDLANMLVWHQDACPRCANHHKCDEWWEIIDEFKGPEISAIENNEV